MREIKLRESLLDDDDDDRDRVRDTTERESESLALQASCFAVNFISLSHGAGHKISYPYLHLFLWYLCLDMAVYQRFKQRRPRCK